MSEARYEERPAANEANLPNVAVYAKSTTSLWLSGYDYGFRTGREERQAEIDRLNWEADLWYWCYTNRKSPEQFYVHATNELWRVAA